MNILHFTLGFPPFRTGGLTRYALDLMRHQVRAQGHRVTALFPGSYTLFSRSRIRPRREFESIQVYELENPGLVPLLNGVANPTRITRQPRSLPVADQAAFLDKIRPDVLHVHTLMGLPADLLRLAKDRGVRIVFSAHDYYGICPRATLVDPTGGACEGPSPVACDLCNQHAPGKLATYLHGKQLLHRFKPVIRKWIPTRPALDVQASWKRPDQARAANEYAELLELHRRQLESVDTFHFPSSVCESVYRNRFPRIDGARIPVIHAGIHDRRSTSRRGDGAVKLGFVGDSTAFKGYPFLREVLSRLHADGVGNWLLRVLGPGHEHDDPGPGIRIEGPFGSGDLDRIYADMDLLVVPSLWRETFSLVALEAMSFGVPVVVLSNVGAKDVVESFAPELVVGSASGLEPFLAELFRDPARLEVWKEKLLKADLPLDHSRHCDGIQELYGRS